MPSVFAKHVTDPSQNFGPFDSIEAAREAVQEAGGHILGTYAEAVVWSDFPRKSSIPPILNIPPLNLTLLTDRLTGG